MAYGTDDFAAGVGGWTGKRNGLTAFSGGAGGDAGADDSVAYLTAVTCATQTQVAKVKCVATPAAGGCCGVGVRLTTAATRGGYWGGHDWASAGAALLTIWKWTEAGVWSSLIIHGSINAALNDVFALRATVNGASVDLELFVNDVSRLTWTDATGVLAGTRVGIIVQHGTGGVAVVDDFEGGDFGGGSVDDPPISTLSANIKTNRNPVLRR